MDLRKGRHRCHPYHFHLPQDLPHPHRPILPPLPPPHRFPPLRTVPTTPPLCVHLGTLYVYYEHVFPRTLCWGEVLHPANSLRAPYAIPTNPLICPPIEGVHVPA